MVKALSPITVQESTKETGQMIEGMEWAMKDSPMETFTKANIETEKFTDKENTLGSMVIIMMDNGSMDRNKAMGLGRIMKMNSIVASGLEISQMALESTLGRMGMSTKESGRLVLGMARAVISLVSGIITLENISMERPKDMVSTVGIMEIFISASFLTG